MKIRGKLIPVKFSKPEKITLRASGSWFALLSAHLQELSRLQHLPQWYRDHVKLVRFYRHPFWFARKPLVKNGRIYIPVGFFTKQKPVERVRMIVQAVATSHKQLEVGGFMPYNVGKFDYTIFHGQNGFHAKFAHDIDEKTKNILAYWIQNFGGG